MRQAAKTMLSKATASVPGQVQPQSNARGATLEIIETPGIAWCMACSKSVEIKQRYEPCPSCGSYQLQVTGGEEMRVKELEVD